MSKYKDEIKAVLARMDNEEQQQTPETSPPTPPDEIQDIYVLIVREHEEDPGVNTQVVDSIPTSAPDTPTTPVPVTPQLQKTSFLPAYAICSFYLFLIVSCIAFQVYEILNPPVATITIIPKSQTVTLNGTLQLGRLLQPITISQSQTTPTTGHGHQDARNATGTVTFFNGLFTQQFIASGTVYTGQDGVEIVTTQDATIPPGNPGSGYGTLRVTAQALQAGNRGNIRSGDIDIAINNGLLVRNSQFYNGQDERNFQTVAKSDITNVESTLKSSLALSIQGALAAQSKPNETLAALPCSPTVTPNRNVGDEATQVKVTVSMTCSAIAYDPQALTLKATQLLTPQASKKLGIGYSLFGTVTVNTVQASTTNTSHPLVFLTFKASGSWVYGLSSKAQELIKKEIEGKTKDQALQILAAMPGIERGSIQWGEDTRLPKNSRYIHIILFVS